MTSVLLGAIADDVTGATDLGAMLSRNGMDVVQVLGLPPEDEDPPEADAIIVALKTRAAPAEQAVEESLAAARWLLALGADQLLFKYGSTFDSSDAGNIGPVAEALLELVGGDLTVVCPAYPENGRTVYQGHLFVGDRLLSESGMQHHPQTPMTDADLVRVMGRQVRRADSVGLVPYQTVEQGSAAIRVGLDHLREEGVRFAVVDAVKEDHLWSLAGAVADMPLLTGGAGLARGLPANYRRTDLLPQRVEPRLPELRGPVAILSGSCSDATRAQVAVLAERHPALPLDPMALAEGSTTLAALLEKAVQGLESGAVLVHSTAPPDEVERIHDALGAAKATAVLEDAFGAVAAGLVEKGVSTFVLAGGETSGAVAARLGLRCLRFGPEIDRGVPWTLHLGDPAIHLAFKSGRFGAEDFFLKALEDLAS
jgi:uncharacterized protein YgbK (DUF1537 family)